MADGEALVSVDYEVSGKVQGVFFRKYTQVRAAAPRGGLPALPAISPLRTPWRGRAGSRPWPRAELRLLLKGAGIAVLLAAGLGYVRMTKE